jgi:hypothetical protein
MSWSTGKERKKEEGRRIRITYIRMMAWHNCIYRSTVVFSHYA